MTVAAARAAGMSRASGVVPVNKPHPADPKHPAVYEVTDQPPGRHSERWTRVVAVICLGKKWQFTDFPFKVLLPVPSRLVLVFWCDGLCRAACLLA